MELLNAFSVYWDVVLSLNLNEAIIVHSVLTKKKQGEEDLEKMCEEIFEKLNIDTVVVHTSKQSLARNTDGLHTRKSFYIQSPAISSGAGDNFNAGFCIGKLMGLETGTSLLLGHATSSLYMQSTNSPTVAEVLEFLSRNLSDTDSLQKIK